MFKKISKPNFPNTLLLLILGSVFLSAFLTELLPIPRAFMLFVDVAWGLLFLLLIKNASDFAHVSLSVKLLLGVVLAFFLSSVVGFLLGRQSPL